MHTGPRTARRFALSGKLEMFLRGWGANLRLRCDLGGRQWSDGLSCNTCGQNSVIRNRTHASGRLGGRVLLVSPVRVEAGTAMRAPHLDALIDVARPGPNQPYPAPSLSLPPVASPSRPPSASTDPGLRAPDSVRYRPDHRGVVGSPSPHPADHVGVSRRDRVGFAVPLPADPGREYADRR